MPTDAVLELNRDHALARDAIHTAMDMEFLECELAQSAFSTLRAWSCAQSRSEYLRRPDLGRSLHQACIEALRPKGPTKVGVLTVVVADGLSALAPASHATAMLERLRAGLTGWTLDPIVLATQARVALGDEIGEIRRAEAVLVLIGERPGLRSPDSLGAYLTYRPRRGRMDSERNCVSNIRPAGLSYSQASFRLLHLLSQARALGATGVSLKDDSGDAQMLTANKNDL
jgi:ethanolamine ammonia-lyase small subunit